MNAKMKLAIDHHDIAKRAGTQHQMSDVDGTGTQLIQASVMSKRFAVNMTWRFRVEIGIRWLQKAASDAAINQQMDLFGHHLCAGERVIHRPEDYVRGRFSSGYVAHMACFCPNRLYRVSIARKNTVLRRRETSGFSSSSVAIMSLLVHYDARCGLGRKQQRLSLV